MNFFGSKEEKKENKESFQDKILTTLKKGAVSWSFAVLLSYAVVLHELGLIKAEDIFNEDGTLNETAIKNAYKALMKQIEQNKKK